MNLFCPATPLWISLFAFVHGLAAEESPYGVFVPADDVAVAIMGRVAFGEGTARMGFPGVTIRLTYAGPAPTLSFSAGNENCYFNTSLNEAQPVVMKLKEGENLVSLPFGEAPAAGWVVEIVRRTESWMGEAAFHGLYLPDGCELLPPPVWPKRKLMFIGDSTTCGEFNERFPPEEEISPRTTNVERSYGMILADRLDAQVHLVAYGGQGIVRDWSGATEGEDVSLAPDYFERTLPRLEALFWDHTQYQPDAIIINLGTDFDSGLPEEEDYYDVYTGFVEQVRTAYPLSYIMLVESNFLSDQEGSEGYEARQQLRRTLEVVVERGREAGDRRIGFAAASYYPGTPKDPHLTVQQHQQLADELIDHLRQVTGWKE